MSNVSTNKDNHSIIKSFKDLDGVLYINLDIRKDRKKLIESHLDKLQIPKEKIYRIPAVFDLKNGHRGCSKSHYNALLFALKKKWRNVLILEDDAIFPLDGTNPNSELEALINHTKEANTLWDVLLLGGLVKEKQESATQPRISQVTNSLRTHAYIVNQHYLVDLLLSAQESYELLKNRDLSRCPDGYTEVHAYDRVWSKLQKTGNWFMSDNLFANQRDSKSDISGYYREER